MAFPSAFQIASNIARYVDFHIIDAVGHGHGWGSPYLCRIGDAPGSLILYSYGDPIHIDGGPQTYEGVPISTIGMGMGVPISM